MMTSLRGSLRASHRVGCPGRFVSVGAVEAPANISPTGAFLW